MPPPDAIADPAHAAVPADSAPAEAARSADPLDPLGSLDPLGLRSDAPLLDAYLRALEGDRAPFTIPGHKGRTELAGAVVAGDVPLYGGLDTPKLALGVLAEAERRAARLWGADVARFSVGGSTHGNQALALAVGRPGDRVVVARTLHRSLLLGLVLAGLEPVWVRPDVDRATGLPLGVPLEAVEAALAATPGACAVFVGDPSYVGSSSDLAGLARAAHSRDIPLVVDAAWGAHFGFHPALPHHAISQGADAVVTSAHKMLPAYSGSSIVLARTERLDPGRLDRAFEATHTTSPAGSILASADAARAVLELHGERLLGRAIELVAMARRRLARVEGLVVAEPPGGDPLRLVLLLAETGASGIDVDRDLVAAGLPVEMTDRDTVAPIVTMADDEANVGRLLAALEDSIERHRGSPRKVMPAAAWSVEPLVVLPPRDAFFAPRERVAIDAAVGRTSVELVAPYPPGIPVLSPGEEVTAEALDALLRARDDGVRIAYAADPTLRTLDVVAATARRGTRGRSTCRPSTRRRR